MPKIGTGRRDIVFGSTKKWNAVVSTAFRQWIAKSHCKDLHGYAMSFEATFEATELDSNNWVVDFGSLKTFKAWLENMFDHTTLVARNDPHLDWYVEGQQRGVMNVRTVDATGCEAVALMTFERLEDWLIDNGLAPRVSLVKLQVWEHDGNSAYVRRARVQNGE